MYIVIEIQTGENVGNFVWAFNTLAEAEAKYHSVLAVAAVSSLPVHSCVIVRNDGLQMAAQCYKHPSESEEE